jgi:hypothetical protein
MFSNACREAMVRQGQKMSIREQQQAQVVTVENFPRAESDLYFASIVKDGALESFTIGASLHRLTNRRSFV